MVVQVLQTVKRRHTGYETVRNAIDALISMHAPRRRDVARHRLNFGIGAVDYTSLKGVLSRVPDLQA